MLPLAVSPFLSFFFRFPVPPRFFFLSFLFFISLLLSRPLPFFLASLSIYFSACVRLFVFSFLCFCLSLSGSVHVCLCLCLIACVCISLPMSGCVSASLYSYCSFLCLVVCLFACLFFCASLPLRGFAGWSEKQFPRLNIPSCVRARGGTPRGHQFQGPR